MEYLSSKFLDKYPDFAPHQSEISKFVYLRTYSRYLESQKRREVWRETPARVINFSLDLERKHREKLGLPVPTSKMVAEAEELYDNVFNLRQFPSGRTMWVGGAEGALAEKFALANFNCSFTNIETWEDVAELFYLLLVGTGVGFKAIPELVEKLPAVRKGIKLQHDPYETLYPAVKVDETQLFVSNGEATIQIGDSKEGWVDACRKFFQVLSEEKYENVHTLTMNYNLVRPSGARLHTFGGTASGPEPLREMFDLFLDAINNRIDPTLAPLEEVKDGYVKVRPITILDIANGVGHNVVVGGVRRTAEIALISPVDFEAIFAKYGINGFWTEGMFERHDRIRGMLESQGIPVPGWWDELATKKAVVFYGKEKKWFDSYEEAIPFANEVEGFIQFPANPGRSLEHRRMSNNSIAFTDKPTREFLNLVFEIMRGEGEPGFVNLRELAMRRFKSLGILDPTEEQIQALMLEIGMNPCAEIDLRSKGVCNLTTINATAFVKNGKLQKKKLLRAQRLSARIGIRMTLIQLELPNWDKVQQQDRLLGCSVTGWKDAMEQLGFTRKQEQKLLKELHDVANDEARRYAHELRINPPLLVCTVKPEGTISNVAVNAFGSPVSSGVHMGHAPHFVRRIRANANDPVVRTAIDLGWTVNPEVGTKGDTHEERMANARTLVVDFPVASGAKRTKDEVTVEDQFNTYFDFQEFYTDHNASNTITIKAEEGEWEKAEQIVWDNWDRFTAVSFLAFDGGSYSLTPFETCTEEKYEELKASMKPFDLEILRKYDVGNDEETLLIDETCAGGACPTR